MTSRDTIREVVGKEITDVSNYPTDIQCNLWGASLTGLIDRTTDAVMAQLKKEEETHGND